MTTYSAIPSGDRDPDSPLTTGLINKMIDNPLAIQEGDASAPKIQSAAIQDEAIVSSKFLDAATGSFSVSTPTGSGGTTSTSYQKRLEIYCARGGTFSVRFGGSASTGFDDWFGRIYVNGAAVGTIRSGSNTTFNFFTEDITVNNGDLLQVYVKSEDSGNTGSVGLLEVSVAVPLLSFGIGLP